MQTFNFHIMASTWLWDAPNSRGSSNSSQHATKLKFRLHMARCVACVVLLLQWPLQACTAVAQVEQQQPKSPGVYAVVNLLTTFLSSGMHILVLQAVHSGRACKPVCGSR